MARSVLFAPRAGPAGRLGSLRFAGRVDGGHGVPHGRPRRYDSYALMYVVAGEGRYRDPAMDVPLGPGDVVYVLPGHPHWYGPVGRRTWDELHLAFTGPVFDAALAQGVIDPGRPVRRLGSGALWQHRIDAFRLRRPPRAATGRDREACDLLRLLVDLDTETTPGAGGPPGDWFARSQQLLVADLAEPVDLAGIAATVGMPYETWRRRFAARAGVSPARFRRLHRIDAAAELLGATSLTVREIAAVLGFSDEHHLNRHFRAATGLTPRGYREQT